MSPSHFWQCSYRWNRENQHGGTRERGKQRRSPSHSMCHANPGIGPYQPETMQSADDHMMHDYQVLSSNQRPLPEWVH